MASTGFQRPTFTALLDRIRDDINSRLTSGDARVRGTVPWVFAYVLAAIAHGLYGFLSWIARQLLPITGDEETVELWRAILGLPAIPAAQAAGSVKFTGTIGLTAIPAGTAIVRVDGVRYTTDAPAALPAGAPLEVVVAVTAEETNSDGNADAGTLLDLVSPIAGIDTTSTVESPGLIDGRDDEGTEEKRERVLSRMADTPQGGSIADYRNWAREVADVEQVWPVGNSPSAGDVTVRFTVEQDGATSTIIPSAGKVSEVAAHLAPLIPATATLYTVAPVGLPVILVVSLGVDTAAIRAAVEESVQAMLVRLGAPGSTIRNSSIREAISSATGEEWHQLLNVQGGSGLADLAVGPTEAPYLSNIAWV